jgi:hypothetical protein
MISTLILFIITEVAVLGCAIFLSVELLRSFRLLLADAPKLTLDTSSGDRV